MQNRFSKFLSGSLVFMLTFGSFGLPFKLNAAAVLSITCDAVSINGNVWTMSGTWKAYDIDGKQYDKYNVGVYSPSGTVADDSSKDSPDTFMRTKGPFDYTGDKQEDMEGTWSNQITFNTTPASISAALYHANIPGNETSGDAFCTFDINDAPVLSNVPTSASIPELAPYTFTATAIDADLADTLTFSLLNNPSGSSINSSTGVFAWTPTETQGPGVYPFTVRVSDGVNNTDASITITVTEVNIAPVASNTSVSTPMNTATSVTFSATDADIPANTLTYSVVANPTHGTLSAVVGNAVTYTPNTSYVGADSFTWRVNDGTVNSNTATVSITVSNNAPVITPITDKTVAEGSNLSFSASATDANNNSLTFSISGAPAGSTFNTSTGAFSFTPSEAQGGQVYTVTISVTDGAATDSTTFTIAVTEVNDTPVADAKSASTDEDTPVVVTLSGSDTDLPAPTLTFALGTGPSHGSVTFSNNEANYAPNANYNGSDSFTYTVSDGVATSSPATVSITVNPVNDAPTLGGISNEGYTIDELTNLSFTATSSDVDDDTLVFSLVDAPAGATIGSSSGVFSWTPTEAQGAGVYNFDVQVTDGTVYVSLPVTVTVNEVNVAPVATDASVTTPMNTSVNITLSGTDSDIPVQILTFTTGTASNGTVTLVNNVATYIPNADFVGSDSFTYKVNDGLLDSNTATISITVSNDAPVLSIIEDKTVDELAPLTFTVSATDANEDTLTYSLGTGAPTGASINSGTGEFSWTPTEAQGPGVYSVTVNVTDGAATDSKTFLITVNEVNIAPVADAKSVTTDEDTVVVFNLTGSDIDLPVQSLSFAVATGPSHGTVGLSGSQVTYTPSANYNGSDSFTFTVNDGVVASAEATVSITVNPVNDAPTIELNGSENVSITTGGAFTDPGATCSDIDSEGASVSTNGEVNTQTPGTYTITYKCVDSNEEESNQVTRTVVVQNAPAMCADGKDNDEDGKMDFGGENSDPGCESANDNDETDPVVTPPSGGGSSQPSGHGIPFNWPQVQPQGQVLGASTAACEIYAKKFLRKNYKNDPVEVKKLQQFLQEYYKSTLPITGLFGNQTEKEVKKFQTEFTKEVLTPWGIKTPTGIAYLTTIRQINKIKCPELDLPLPALVPFSQNPEAPKN